MRPGKPPQPCKPLLHRVDAGGLGLVLRFNRHVDRSGACHLWTASKTAAGYGQIKIGLHRYFAHRVAWVIANRKDIPEGMAVCHACDVPACVNPEHLWLGSWAENAIDMHTKGRGRSFGWPRINSGNVRTPAHVETL